MLAFRCITRVLENGEQLFVSAADDAEYGCPVLVHIGILRNGKFHESFSASSVRRCHGIPALVRFESVLVLDHPDSVCCEENVLGGGFSLECEVEFLVLAEGQAAFLSG